MDRVIDSTQSALIPGRLITNNILIGFECMNWLRNSKSKEGYAALKLDMSKAYDRVEWRFIEAIMCKLGFSAKWIEFILRCVKTVTYTFRVNATLTDQVIPSRGLRQGDPLSPFLFVLCAQGFSSIIKGYQRQGLIRGLRMANRGQQSHIYSLRTTAYYSSKLTQKMLPTGLPCNSTG